MKKVFIVGSEGTTGLRLRERLAARTDVELLTIEDGLRKNTDEILRLMGKADFTFLCLPDDAAREIAALAPQTGGRLIDASTAHRTSDGWAYGFPERSAAYREAIQNAARVAVPGCHASGFIALTAPLVDAGLLSPDAALCCASLTGYSGGGKKMIAEYENPQRGDEYKSSYLYAMGQQHKHLPEMSKHAGLTRAPLFTPVVGGYYAGMTVTVPISGDLLPGGADADTLREVLRKHYAKSPVIRVSQDEPTAIFSSKMQGRDDMEIYVTGEAGRYQLTAVFDNLGKGASGAAIQCLNIMCGAPEETGLALSHPNP